MNYSARKWRFAIALTAASCAVSAMAAPVDFTQFLIDDYPPTDGFPSLAFWNTTPDQANLDDSPFGSFNAGPNVFYSPDDALGKRFVGEVTAHPRTGDNADDDVFGFVLGYGPGDAFFNLDADFLLIDWKGTNQNFDFGDPAGEFPFNELTTGGIMPAGLALSRVSGTPTADELWQHIDSPDGLDGGVTELARGNSLGNVGYDRSADAEPYIVDITYTADRVTVVVDGVLQFDETGSFPQGRFGLYTAWQGPTPVFSNFDVTDAGTPTVPEVSATIDRATGELVLQNDGAIPAVFSNYDIASDIGSLNAAEWSSITNNYDEGAASGVDSDAWSVDSMTDSLLAESESGGADGASLAAGDGISLGNVWTPSRFEDVTLTMQLTDSFIVPIVPEFIGNGGEPFARSDLNTDGVIDESDWLLFFPNSLSDFAGMSTVQAALLGDLDGDFDNDVLDFGIFKSDFEAANGVGAFAAMAAGVPEPASVVSMLLLLLAGVGMWRVHRSAFPALLLLIAVFLTSSATAQPLDFDQFTLERFPPTGGFGEADWDTTVNTATITAGANASANVLYSPMNVIGNRIRGFLDPSTDDDVVGFVLGFEPGDASFGPDSEDADYMLLDWKGLDQTFNFADPDPPVEEFNNLTGGGFMPAGIALSRVTGLANADELWQHDNLEENELGGVEELARGITLGATAYDRDAAALPVEFDILFTENQLVVRVDGVLQFNERGDFSDGRFGVYTGWQSDGPEFSDFELLSPNTLDNLVLSAVVNRETGDIEITNSTDGAISLDYYQFDSNGGTLNDSWQGLADGETGAEADPGNSWVEAGGASANSLAELFLQSSSGQENGITLAPGNSLTLQGAYNSQADAQDLVFSYRFPDGILDAGIVRYEGEPMVGGIDGDYNNNGQVEQGDLDLVLLNWGNTLTDPASVNWTNDLPTGPIDQGELDGVLLNWGNGGALGVAAVPEPTSLAILLAVGGLCMLLRRRHG